MLAFQVGQQVSIHELTKKLAINRETVERYIDLLEKAFVIFRLKAFSRNLRKEINKKEKIYFYDVGIRNSLINRFDDTDIRDDIGGLWENICIIERKKMLQKTSQRTPQYFWRTHDKKEIDYIEEYNGKIYGYEFKKSKKTAKIPKEFCETYPNSKIEIISEDNWWKFIGVGT